MLHHLGDFIMQSRCLNVPGAADFTCNRLSQRGVGSENMQCACAGRASAEEKVPASCPPTASEQLKKCSCCGHAAWQPQAEAAPELGDCEVFLPSAVVRTHFPTYTCGSPGCAHPQTLSTDGIEYGLLRMTADVAYGLELLYHWADKTGTGGIAWFTFWRDTVEKYKGCGFTERSLASSSSLKI